MCTYSTCIDIIINCNLTKSGALVLILQHWIASIDCDKYQTQSDFLSISAWINWVDRRLQLIQTANRKVVLVIFTKEQKSEVRYAFEVTLNIEKQNINLDA